MINDLCIIDSLVKANPNLDEAAARCLLERALIERSDGRLEFARDIRVKKVMSLRDHYVDFMMLFPEISVRLKAAALVVHALPPYYGENSLQSTYKLLSGINQHSKSHIDFLTISGTHHVHMLKPRETAALVLDFFHKADTSMQRKEHLSNAESLSSNSGPTSKL
jgi:hypothetical protein